MYKNWRLFLAEADDYDAELTDYFIQGQYKKETSFFKKAKIAFDSLKKEFAIDNGNSLSMIYFKYSKFGRESQDLKEHSYCSYIIQSKIIIVDPKKLENIKNEEERKNLFVENVLHEIRHFNQHMMWNSYSPDAKMKLSKVWTMPSSDPAELKKLTWLKLVEWWVDNLDYNNRPHEKDAKSFANRNLQKALSSVENIFLKKDIKKE